MAKKVKKPKKRKSAVRKPKRRKDGKRCPIRSKLITPNFMYRPYLDCYDNNNLFIARSKNRQPAVKRTYRKTRELKEPAR